MAVFTCWQCNRRLNVDEVKGKVVVFCPRCRAQNTIERPFDKAVRLSSESPR